MTMPNQPEALRDVVADWLDENYGEHTQQAFGAFQQAADELLQLIADHGTTGEQVQS